jgi:tRNA dimethylallyltransferase
MPSANPLLIILGATASGKTKLAVSVAEALCGEIISADSRQVFKGMDIGTGKDLEEYIVNGNQIPYHLIDIKEPGTRYQVDSFKEDFYKIFELIKAKQKLPILCGGTGMYIHSILQNHEYTSIPVNPGLREALAVHDLIQLQTLLAGYPLSSTQHADQSTQKRLIRAIEIADYLKHHSFIPPIRPSFEPLVIGLQTSVDTRRKRIMERLEQRLSSGLIEEVEGLLKKGVSKEMLVFYGLEYRFVIGYLSGDSEFLEFKTNLYTAICQYAKRQMTFFRKMEKDGVLIHWLAAEKEDNLKEKVIELYKEKFL